MNITATITVSKPGDSYEVDSFYVTDGEDAADSTDYAKATFWQIGSDDAILLEDSTGTLQLVAA